MINTRKLKGRLREQNYTQAELADAMGLAVATVCQKINGVRPITVDEARQIADFLKIPESEYGDYFFYSNSAQRNKNISGY